MQIKKTKIAYCDILLSLFIFSTFEPCWKTIKTSNEMFANSFSHAVQELHDLVKKIREYGEQQKETQKAVSL